MSLYERELRLRSKDVDMHRRLRTSVLFELLQEAAIAHTEALGMGREKTLDRGLLWIVTMQSAEIRRSMTSRSACSPGRATPCTSSFPGTTASRELRARR